MTEEERIRRRAHEIWEREGRPVGVDQQHWERARQEVAEEDLLARAEAAGTATAPPPTQTRPGRLFENPDDPKNVDRTEAGITTDQEEPLISTETQGLPPDQKN